MRKLAASLAVALALGCLLAPGLATGKKGKGKPPDIQPRPLALYDRGDGGVWFSVNVFNAKSVSIHYRNDRRQAKQITTIGGPKKVIKFTWEALFKGGPRRSCYDIVVTAKNRNGSATARRQACRLGQKPKPR